MTETILILDYGSQYNQLIARKIRELGVYCLLVPHDISAPEIKKHNVKGFIFTGGPASVYEKCAPKINKNALAAGAPILGICYGMQVLTHALGGKVKKAKKREYGLNKFFISNGSPLFTGMEKESPCWMSHGDEVKWPAPGFSALAYSRDNCIAALGDDARKYYGVQFHPEVVHTPCGKTLLENFLKICGVKFDFNYDGFISDAVSSIKKELDGGKVFCALSGGVDSLVAAEMAHKAAGDKLKCIFVDNGLLRADEAGDVRENIRKFTKLSLKFINARKRFLTCLGGVKDPERKRKIIGNLFIKIFEEEAKKIKNLKYLVQGTIYPDYIESGASGSSSAGVIKTHHNVGGLPKKMNLKLIEPLKFLFKDEVRKVGLTLGLPAHLLYRQPFPGPGLAVRIIDEVRAPDLKILKHSDKILREEIEKESLNESLWQYFTVLLPVKTVGVMGDSRTYLKTIAIRAVQSQDGMTANIGEIPWNVLNNISTRIVNEVKGVNRVVYDLTSKPPGTIEWE